MLAIGSMSRTLLFSSVLLLAATVLPLSSASAAVDPAPFSSNDPSFSKDVQQLLDGAEKAMKVGKKEEGLRLLNMASNLAPNNPFVVARFAAALNMGGNFQDALTRLQRARKLGAPEDVLLGPTLEAMLSMGQNQVVLDLYPDPGAKTTYSAGMILRGRASALQALGDSAGASAAVQRSLAILNDYDGVMTAARIGLMQGGFDSADAQLDAALKLRPGDIDASILKIDVAMQKKMPAKAQQMAEKLVSDYPRSVAALLTRIKVYLSTDRADKAEPDVDRILEEKALPIARYFKAVILARHNDVKGAWEIAHSLPKEYFQLDPGVAINIANMAIGAGYMDSGATILTVAVQRFPYYTEPRLQLADIRLRQNSPEHAINALALLRDSKDPRVMVLFARVALLKKDRAEARKYLEQAIDAGGGEQLRTVDKQTALQIMSDYVAHHPGNKPAKKQYALLLLGFGDLPKAKELYEQFAAQDPKDALSLNNLSWLVVQDDPRRALALAQAAVRIAPGFANYLDTLGSMQMNTGDYKGAVVSLQKANALAPDNAEFAYHLALALEAAGEGGQSQVLLQTLVKRGGFGELDAAKTLLASKLKMVQETQRGR
jgi:tetratricopeptide (TPR) repeat protein